MLPKPIQNTLISPASSRPENESFSPLSFHHTGAHSPKALDQKSLRYQSLRAWREFWWCTTYFNDPTTAIFERSNFFSQNKEMGSLELHTYKNITSHIKNMLAPLKMDLSKTKIDFPLNFHDDEHHFKKECWSLWDKQYQTWNERILQALASYQLKEEESKSILLKSWSLALKKFGREIKIADTHIQTDSLLALLNYLKNSRLVEALNFEGSSFANKDRSMEILVTHLAVSPHIQSLNLKSTNINDDDCLILATGIFEKHTKHLASINLSNTALTENGYGIIFDALTESQPTLEIEKNVSKVEN